MKEEGQMFNGIQMSFKKISSGIAKWFHSSLFRKLTLGSIPLLPTACK